MKFHPLLRSPLWLVLSYTATALNGGTSRIRTFNDWKAIEIISEGESMNGDWEMPAKFDGAGAFAVDADTIRIHVNHELSEASISEVNVDTTALQQAISNKIASNQIGDATFVNSAGIAYDRWSDDGGDSFETKVSPDKTDFCRFCSSQAYAANTYGTDRGFVDQLYITGEECGNGRLFALDSNERELYQISGVTGKADGEGNGGMSFDQWENAALMDTGETEHIALLLSPDGSSSTQYVKLYIGQKGKNTDGDTATDFLSRNGLAYGEWFYLKEEFPDTDGDTHSEGSFQKKSSGALGDGKLEDIDTNPSHPTQVVLAETNTGLYTLEFELAFFAEEEEEGGGFNVDDSAFSITKIPSDTITNPDNVDWTVDGHIFVNEDSSSGAIWRLRPDGSSRVKVGETTVVGESSGIFDLSALLDYTPGSIMVTTNQGSVSSMTILINPAAEALHMAQKPVGALVYEANEAIIVDSTMESTYHGFSGDGYANLLAIGSSLEWTVDSLVAGRHVVHVAYASENARPAAFLVDGAHFGEFSFPGTGGWTHWNTETFVVDLTTAGSHTFQVLADTSTGSPHIDWLAIQSPEATEALHSTTLSPSLGEPVQSGGGAAGSKNLRGAHILENFP